MSGPQPTTILLSSDDHALIPSQAMEEPNMAVQLVEELVKAGADPGRYQEAILLRAFQCRWPACTAALRERCGADINKLADAAFAEDARKNAINKTFSGSLGAAQHAPPSTVLRGSQYLKLSLVVETEKHVDYINSAHLNAAGTTLFTACNDGFLRLFRVSDGAEVGQSVFECGSLMQAAWSPDGQCVATAGTNGRLGVHDTATDALPLLFDFEHVNPTTHELSKLSVLPNPSTHACTTFSCSIRRLTSTTFTGSTQVLCGVFSRWSVNCHVFTRWHSSVLRCQERCTQVHLIRP